MHRNIGYLWMVMLLTACNSVEKQPEVASLPLVGTWELIAASSTQNDTTTSTFDSTRKMIKIINPTHFAFLNHSIKADSVQAPFYAGGGSYTLVDSIYTEHLDYFSDKAWEGHTFEFVIKIVNDTLIQQGGERVEALGIDHIIVEQYKRVQ